MSNEKEAKAVLEAFIGAAHTGLKELGPEKIKKLLFASIYVQMIHGKTNMPIAAVNQLADALNDRLKGEYERNAAQKLKKGPEEQAGPAPDCRPKPR